MLILQEMGKPFANMAAQVKCARRIRCAHQGPHLNTIGRYKMRIPAATDTFATDRGKYVSHWHRMADGQFRVILSTWHSDSWHRLSDSQQAAIT
jgi:hypothetical protein